MEDIIKHLKSLLQAKEALAKAHLDDIERAQIKLADTQAEIAKYEMAITVLEDYSQSMPPARNALTEYMRGIEG